MTHTSLESINSSADLCAAEACAVDLSALDANPSDDGDTAKTTTATDDYAAPSAESARLRSPMRNAELMDAHPGAALRARYASAHARVGGRVFVASMMARMKELEDENRRLKKMYLEEKLKAEIANEYLAKK